MANPVVATLALIAAKAKTYPAYVKDFGRTISVFASIVKTYVDAQVLAAKSAALTPSLLTVPSKTSTELDAIDDATAGDVYFDSTNSKLVVFTGAAAYETVTSAGA